MNDCLHELSGSRQSPRRSLEQDVEIFERTFAGEADLAMRSPAALRVLAMAAALFYRRGAAGTSIRDITRSCGLTPGALYNHFPSKDDLLDTIVRHGHARMQQRLDDALGAVSEDPALRLAAFVRAYVGGHLAAPELAQVVRREYLHLSPERYTDVVRQRRRIRRLLESILDAGVRAGHFDIVGGTGALTGQAVMVLDLCSRTSEWFDRGGAIDADVLTARYVEVVTRMVQVTTST